MMRKFLALLVVLALLHSAAVAENQDLYDLESVDESVVLAQLAEQAANSDNVFSQFVSDDEDDEKDDYDDEKELERERRREAKERRREIRRIRKERRAKARLARGPIYNLNATATVNGTNTANSTRAGGRKKNKKRQFNKKFLDAKEKKMLKDTHRFERIARRERARAEAHGATVAALRSIRQENKLQSKIARDNGKITYELRSAMDSINSVKNNMERDAIQDDERFWDAFYGKKAHANVTTPTTPEIIMKAQHDAEAKMEKDLALPIYKVSHIASFEEAYGRSKKVPKLDDSLKEDGEKYISYVSLFN